MAGLLFLLHLDRLWPLVRADLVGDEARLCARARDFLRDQGFDVAGFSSAEWLRIDTQALDYVDRSFGRERVQFEIDSGSPVVRHRIGFKRRGRADGFTVDLAPAGRVLGWQREIEDDEPGARIDPAAARQAGIEALEQGLGLDPRQYEETAVSTTERPARRDHVLWYERLHSETPELRERVWVRIAGAEVVDAGRRWLVPDETRRQARAAEAPSIALETVGFSLLGVGALGGFLIFLRRLQRGLVDLDEAAIWPSAVLACFLATYALQRAELFVSWEPLWPRWVSAARYVFFAAGAQAWIAVVLLAVVAAGFAIDRASSAGRGESLRRLGRGRLLDPSVVRASRDGFLVGLLCGGVMTLAVVLLDRLADARVALQPRGFFFYPLNASSPAAMTLLFFFGVALTEELGYRFFGGGWLLATTRRRWVAVLVPAIIYGLTHTRMDFLPPAEPFWGRALVLALVGCVWGWAFLRYDALTVVLSHFTADLFIFNWPRMASGEPWPMVASLLTIGVPLVPALLGLVRRLTPRRPSAATIA